MAICREFGPPDFFVTFTCNPNWPEIAAGLLEAGQRATDRADIIVRVFNMKLEDLLHDIKKGNVFSPCSSGIYTALLSLFLFCLAVVPTPNVFAFVY